MPRQWHPKARRTAELLWVKKERYNREQVREELLKRGYDVPIDTIRKWTPMSLRNAGEPWDFAAAPLEEGRGGP